MKFDYPYTMVVNKDEALKDKGSNGTSEGYVHANPESIDYFMNGQEIEVVNAVMYTRIRYNQWMYYPPDGVHTLDVWHDSVMNFGKDK